MITKVINVNLHQPIYERLTAKQGDIASRYLLFHLLDGDKPFDLTNRTVRVYAIKPDKTEIFNDLTINDASKGYCTLELTSQCLASAGVVKMELYISESGKVLTSIPFELEVIPCINTTNGVISTNEFSALEVALSSLQDYDNLRREIVQARKGHETVGKRLDNIVQEVEEDYYKKGTVNTMVNNKVTIGEARENTDVKPINYREFDTETKQLFTGGNVAVVGDKTVGTENVKDLAITSNLRTALGSYALISCSSIKPIIIHIGLKKLIFPSGENNLLINNTTIYKIPSEYEIDLSGNGYSCSLFYDTIEQEFKYYEDGTANENCVFLGIIWWGTEGYKNSIFNFDYVLEDAEEESKEKIVKRKNIEMKPMDEEEAILEMELLGHSFFVYISDNPNSLSSCCRLKNEKVSSKYERTI